MVIPDKIYNVLKWILLILLPALATLLAALNSAWGWNLPIEAILATFSAVETFGGVLLGISTYGYTHTTVTEGDEDDTASASESEETNND